MMKALVRFCLTREIDARARGWEQQVFTDTHLEFFMQAQSYDPEGRYATFQEMVNNLSDAADLHYLVSTAAIGYIRQLNGMIPGVTDASGMLCLPFENFRFELVESHRTWREHHRVRIHFYSDPLIFVDAWQDEVYVVRKEDRQAWESGSEVFPLMFRRVPGLTMGSVQSLTSLYA